MDLDVVDTYNVANMNNIVPECLTCREFMFVGIILETLSPTLLTEKIEFLCNQGNYRQF